MKRTRSRRIWWHAKQSVLLRLFDEKAEEAAVRAMIREAKRGNVPAFKELMDRKYGKVKDQIEMSGANGGPLLVREVVIEVPRVPVDPAEST